MTAPLKSPGTARLPGTAPLNPERHVEHADHTDRADRIDNDYDTLIVPPPSFRERIEAAQRARNAIHQRATKPTKPFSDD